MEARHLFLLIFFYLAAGTFFSLGWLRPPALGRRYILFHGFFAVLLSLVALLGVGPLTPLAVQWGLVTFSVFATGYLVTMRALPTFSALSFFLAFAAAIVTIFADVQSWSLSAYPTPSFLTNALLSTGLLGATLALLLLGHWLSPGQKAQAVEMKRLVFLFTAFILTRSAFSTYSVISAVDVTAPYSTYRYFLSASPGLFLLIRWAWGILAPLLLTYLAWLVIGKAHEERSTSVWYVLLLFVLTGETLSLYLALFHHLPV